MKQTVIRYNGESADKVSISCPKCATRQIDSTTGSEMTFDENGWYYLVTLTCKNPKCSGRVKEKGKEEQPFKWHEKIVAMGGGTKHDPMEHYGV